MQRLLAAALTLGFALPAAAAELAVARQTIDDRKAVIASVQPVDVLLARARIGGTVAALAVKDGDRVSAGQRIAVVADEKLLLQMRAVEARIQSLEAERRQASIDLERAQELRRSGVGTQARLDEARTRLQVTERNIAAMSAERQVVEQQSAEGAVLAPGAGVVLKVPVVEGTVVLPGETIATMAAQNYVLRAELPERHARFMKEGDEVLVGARGLGTETEELQPGRVRLVYPEIQAGRVVADIEVAGLGDYFVGERTRLYVSTGKREGIVIPPEYLFRRFGVSFVRLRDGGEVAVQPGLPANGGVEILAGLRDGDVLVRP
jgi:RND family efflux transporter MFP subunit